METNKLVMTDPYGEGDIYVEIYKCDGDKTVADGGYVSIRLDTDHYLITVLNCEGDVISETRVPLHFKIMNLQGSDDYIGDGDND